MKRLSWTARRFVFDLPASLSGSVIERLRGTPARVEDRIRDLAPETLVRREGTSWSIQENVGHLLEVEPLWHGRLDDYDTGLEVLRPADMENRSTSAANYNALPIRNVLGGFRDARMLLVTRLESLDQAGIERSAMHPRLGCRMRVLDLMVFIAEHDDHHLARITELIRTFRPQAGG